MKINKEENPDFLNEYIFYMKIIKGSSEQTVNEYYIDIRLFLKYIKKSKNNIKSDLEDVSIADFSHDLLKSITLKDIYDFELYLSEDRKNTNSTRARKISSIKSFFFFLTKRLNLLSKNPAEDIERPSIKKSLPKHLSLEESLKMLSNTDTDNPLRDYCIITLFLNCGMRLSELVNLNKNDIDYTERKMRLLGKGNKERVIYLNDACISSLQDYIKSRENPEQEPHALFLSKQKKRISRRRVQQIVENIFKKSDLDGRGLSTHKLRHTAATLMYQHGNVDTLVLKDILGHTSIATTEIYTHLSDNSRKEAANSSPLAKINKNIQKK